MSSQAPPNESNLHVVDGLKVPDFVSVEKMKSLQLYPDDLWVVTYPKSGTMWTLQIARLIRNMGVQDDLILNDVVGWPEGEKVLELQGIETKTEDLPHPRLFWSHFPYPLFPCGSPNTTPCKFINVMRNPKDVAVSLYNFQKLVYVRDLEWDTFWKMFMDGDVMYGDYFDHILSWWPHRNDENVLMLKYEDMKRDLPQAITQIASFMGVDLPGDVVTKIADLVGFEKMKSDDTANMSWVKIFHEEDGKPGFLRKGVVGDWKNFLSAEQSAELDRKCAEKLKDTGIEFDYE